MDRREIEAFCDNLKTTLLEALENKTPIHICQKNDNDDVFDQFGMVVDVRNMGCIMYIFYGRPAEKFQSIDRTTRRYLESRLIGEL